MKDDIEKLLFEGLQRYEQPCSGDDSSLRHCREISELTVNWWHCEVWII